MSKYFSNYFQNAEKRVVTGRCRVFACIPRGQADAGPVRCDRSGAGRVRSDPPGDILPGLKAGIISVDMALTVFRTMVREWLRKTRLRYRSRTHPVPKLDWQIFIFKGELLLFSWGKGMDSSTPYFLEPNVNDPGERISGLSPRTRAV